MLRFILATAIAATLSLAVAPLASAAPFLPSYTGPQNEALDLASIAVTFDGTNFDLNSVSSAPIGSAPAGSLFVWGVNRGTGAAGFVTATPTATNPSIGSNVLFDAVLAINPGTDTATVVNTTNGMATPLPAAVSCGGLAAINDHLYYYGGLNATDTADQSATWGLDLAHPACGRGSAPA